MTSKDKPPRGAGSGRPTGSKHTGSKSSGAKASGPKSAGAKPGGFKPSGFKASGSRSGDGAKPSGAKPASARFGGEKASGVKPDGARSSGQKGEGRARLSLGKPSFAGDEAGRREGADGREGAGKPAFARKGAPRTGGRDEARAERPRFDKTGGSAAAPVRARKAETLATTDDAPQRISKILARAGVASRRDIERMIMEGRVSLNGVVLDTPVVNVTLSDRIEVDGQPIRGIERTRLWLYHKPAGLVTTNSDPEGRPTVFDRLPEDLPRVLSIGRLDINTEGLLLLTNDGGLARVLELPSTGWLRRYRVRAHGAIEQAELDKLKDGIAVDGVLYGSIEATLDKVQGSNVWITMGLREGKNREIKNVLGALGLEVNRLIRVSYGPFQLAEIPEGAAQEIRGRTLRDQLGPRLIEEAKANFDAPLFNDSPAVSEDKDEPEPARSAGRERPAFREDAGDRRERLRARLDTRPDGGKGGSRGGRDGARGGERSSERDGDRFEARPKRQPAQRKRTTNVWMAPGARPVAEKRAEGEAAEAPIRRERPDGAPKSKRFGRTPDGKLTKSARKFDPDRKSDDRAPSARAPSRAPRAARTVDGEGEWITASPPAPREERGGGRGRDGERPGRGRGGDEAPRGRSEGRDERGGRSFGDRPARGDRPFGDKPFGARSAGDRPAGGKSFGDRPKTGKSFGGKPGGGKSFGGRPSGGKPSGGRPAGGGKPRGRGN